MEISVEKMNDISIFSLTGRLDTLSSPSLKEALDPVVNGQSPKIVMDFSELSFISSSGLRILLEANKMANKNQGKLILCALQTIVEEVFSVAGFSIIFHIYPTREEALAQLS